MEELKEPIKEILLSIAYAIDTSGQFNGLWDGVTKLDSGEFKVNSLQERLIATPLFDNLGWTNGDALSVESSNTITTTDDFNYMGDNYNIVFPNGIDLKITGASSIPENIGMKSRNRYKLAVTG